MTAMPNSSVRHCTCFRHRLSTHHAVAAPHSASVELEVVGPGKVKSILALGVALMLSACATQNIPGTETYKAVPDSQLLCPLPATAGPDTATVVVKRDPGLYGSVLSSAFTINGKKIALIKPGQFLTLKVAPNEYLFGVAWSDNLGALATGSTREIPVTCSGGKNYVLRMFPQTASGIVIERASQ